MFRKIPGMEKMLPEAKPGDPETLKELMKKKGPDVEKVPIKYVCWCYDSNSNVSKCNIYVVRKEYKKFWIVWKLSLKRVVSTTSLVT